MLAKNATKQASKFVLICLAVFIVPVQAAEYKLPEWQALHYRLSLLLTSASADISVRKVSAAELAQSLVVITSYSIHYTKLYDGAITVAACSLSAGWPVRGSIRCAYRLPSFSKYRW